MVNDQQNTREDSIRLPAILFQSFLLVASAYMLNLLLLGFSGFGLMAFLFPESLELINSAPEEFNRIFEEQPEKVYPLEFLWALLGMASLICFALGYGVARIAPIGKFPHSIFFASILFVQYLQLAINATDSMQRMLVLFMAASPVAAILGANLFLRQEQDRLREQD